MLPINSDPRHFQSYSPPAVSRRQIGEILDTPLGLSSSPPAVPPAINRLALIATTRPGTTTPLSFRGLVNINVRILLLLALLPYHKSAIFHPLIQGLLILCLPTADNHLLLQLLTLLLMVEVFLLQLQERYNSICHPMGSRLQLQLLRLLPPISQQPLVLLLICIYSTTTTNVII
jgi:hypothetical protein